jgi:hypothetical protein
MARQTLGDFHINLLLPLSHIRRSQFQQGIVQEFIQQFGLTQIVLFEVPGGDWYAQAGCTGNQAIYQGASAPHLFHRLYHCTRSAMLTVS